MKYRVHFTVKGLMTSFTEVVESDTGSTDDIKLKLKERIKDITVAGEAPVIKDVFYIEAVPEQTSV